MSGNAHTIIKTLVRGQDHEVIDFECGREVVAARISLISHRSNGVQISHGWVLRTEDDGAQEIAFGRSLEPSASAWSKNTSVSAAITAPDCAFQFYEWIEGGLRLGATSSVKGDGQTVIATLFTDGQFHLRTHWNGEDGGFPINGEECLASAGDLFVIGGNRYCVTTSVGHSVPTTASWLLDQDCEPDVGVRISTDWTVLYRPVRVLAGRHDVIIDSPEHKGCPPDMVTLIQGAVDLPIGTVDDSQTGGSFGLSTATYATQNIASLGYSLLVDREMPASKGWFSQNMVTHRKAPRVQSLLGKPIGWVNDGWKVEFDSFMKANWLAQLWYAPTLITQRVEHETVAGALR